MNEREDYDTGDSDDFNLGDVLGDPDPSELSEEDIDMDWPEERDDEDEFDDLDEDYDDDDDFDEDDDEEYDEDCEDDDEYEDD